MLAGPAARAVDPKFSECQISMTMTENGHGKPVFFLMRRCERGNSRTMLASLSDPLNVVEKNESIASRDLLEISEPRKVIWLLADNPHNSR